MLVNPYTVPALTPHWYVLQLVYPAISLVDNMNEVELVILVATTISELASIIVILYVNTAGTVTEGGNHDNSIALLSFKSWDSEWGAPGKINDTDFCTIWLTKSKYLH